MSFLISTDLKGLAVSSGGQPFADAAIGITGLQSLKLFFQGAPFAGAVNIRGWDITCTWANIDIQPSVGLVSFFPASASAVTPVMKPLGLVLDALPFVEDAAPSSITTKGLQLSFQGQPFVVTRVVQPTVTEVVVPAAGISANSVVGIPQFLLPAVIGQINVTARESSATVNDGGVTIGAAPVSLYASAPSCVLSWLIGASPANTGISASILNIAQVGSIIPPASNISIAQSYAQIDLISGLPPAGLIQSGSSSNVMPLILPISSELFLSSLVAGLNSFDSVTGCEQVFECVLSLEDLDDFTIPISSFVSRRRNGEPSYLSVVIPGLENFLDIFFREQGSVSVYSLRMRGGVVLQRELLISAPIGDIVISGNLMGPSPYAQIQISGYITTTAGAVPEERRLDGVFYFCQDSGIMLQKSGVDFYLKPGDIVIYDEDTSFTAGTVSYTVEPSRSTMVIQEADS